MMFVKPNYAEGANDLIADNIVGRVKDFDPLQNSAEKFQNVVKTYDAPLNHFKKPFLSTKSMSHFHKFQNATMVDHKL